MDIYLDADPSLSSSPPYEIVAEAFDLPVKDSHPVCFFDDFATVCKIKALVAASWLTEPICKVREYYYSQYILNETCSSTVEKVTRAAMLGLGAVVYSILSPAAILGAGLRGLIAATCDPFIFTKSAKEGKVLPESGEITMVSHNVCWMPGGYSITDGQVTPPSDRKRVDANIEAIKKLNPDIICLYEIPDICDANYLSSKLPEYPFIIPVAGMRAIGPSSSMYVASKYEIVKDSIQFDPFIKGEEVSGRAQFAEKGVLSFDIRSKGETFATIFSTHLQHSEVPAKPTDEEVRARAAEMKKIVEKIKEKIKLDRNVIFTGDLNESEMELDQFFRTKEIDWLRRDESIRGQATWEGDLWCAELMSKPASDPQVLDYAFIAGKAESIRTTIVQTGYVGDRFIPTAGSDHNLLFSRIKVGRNLAS